MSNATLSNDEIKKLKERMRVIEDRIGELEGQADGKRIELERLRSAIDKLEQKR